MADDRRGVIQWIRLKVSPQSKQNLKEEARQTAKEAFTDPFGQALGDIGKEVPRKIEPALGRIESAGKKAAAGVQNAFQRAGTGIRGFFNGLNNDITRSFAAFFAASAIKNFVVDMWELGTAAEETGSKFRTTFGESGKEVQAFIDEFGTLLGLNRTLGQEMTSTAGAIVQGMGASQQASADFSTRMVRLAGDLQSFHNVPIQDTFNAIKSGLVGAWEPMDRFGIVLRQAAVDERALMETGKTHADQLTQLEKSQASLNLMFERAGPALGDVERTQGSTANQARNLAAEFQNLRIDIAQGLLPVFATMIDWLSANKEELKTLAKGGLDVVAFSAKLLWGTLNSLVFMITTPVMFAFAMLNGALADTTGLLADAAELAARLARAMGADAFAGEAVHFGNQMRSRAGRARGRADAWLGGIGAQAGDLAQMGLGGFGGGAEGPMVWDAGGASPTVTVPSAGPSAAEAARAQKAALAAAKEAGRQIRTDTQHLDEDVMAALQRSQGELDNWRGALALVDEQEDTTMMNRAARYAILAEETKRAWAPLADFMLDVTDGITAAWSRVFSMILEEGATAGEAMKGLGLGMAAALTGGLAGLARTKAAENVVKAAEDIADAVSALAFPWTAPLAPGKFLAAGKHLAVATGWASLAGVGGAATTALSGGGAYGRTGDYAVARRTGGDIADGANNRWELHVYPGGFNPKDPVHVQILGQGMQELAGTDSRFDIIQH